MAAESVTLFSFHWWKVHTNARSVKLSLTFFTFGPEPSKEAFLGECYYDSVAFSLNLTWLRSLWT